MRCDELRSNGFSLAVHRECLKSVLHMQTETAVRFSLVTHGRDSPEGLRDVRGFATKFYTSEGNWDLVGNNIPVRPLLHTQYLRLSGASYPSMCNKHGAQVKALSPKSER